MKNRAFNFNQFFLFISNVEYTQMACHYLQEQFSKETRIISIMIQSYPEAI